MNKDLFLMVLKAGKFKIKVLAWFSVWLIDGNLLAVWVKGWKSSLEFFYKGIIPWWLRWWSVCLQCGRPGFNPWVGKIPWRRKWQPTLVLLPGNFHGQRSLVGYSPWGRKESDTLGNFIMSLISFIRVPPSRPNHLPKVPPPTITLWELIF